MAKVRVEDVSGMGTENDGKLMGTLRTITIDRMKVIFSPATPPKSPPNPNRHHEDIVFSEKPSLTPDDDDDFKIKIESVTSLVKHEAIEGDKNEIVSNSVTASTSTSSAPASECSYCRENLQQDATCSLLPLYVFKRLRQHLIQYHCEHYFPRHKLDFVTPSQFKKIIAELLFDGLIYGNQNCPFCVKKKIKFITPGRYRNTRYTLATVLRIKSHLMEAHFPELEKMLKKLQNDPDISRKLEECNPWGRVCGCGVYIANLDEQVKHEQFQCLLTDNTTTEEQQTQIQMGAEQYCQVKIEVDDDETLSFQSEEVGVHSVQCSHTSGKTLNTSNSQQPQPSGIGSLTARKSPPQQPRHFKNKFKDHFLVKFPSSCPYCRFRCTAHGEASLSRDMSLHLAQFHPEYFFPSTKCLSVSPAQFQKVLHDILFLECIPEKGDIGQCSLCGHRVKKYQNGWAILKRHFVMRHRENLIHQLKEILEDPNLEERLSLSNQQGVWCLCGMYLPNGIEYKKKYHPKHCKLKVKKKKGSGRYDSTDDVEENKTVPQSDQKNDAAGEDNVNHLIWKELDSIENEEMDFSDEEEFIGESAHMMVMVNADNTTEDMMKNADQDPLKME